MGSAVDDSQSYSDEKPAHSVTVREFWLAKTEISNSQYRQFRANQQGEDAQPATEISWDEAKAACEFLGGCLPTEAEWEYASAGWKQGLMVIWRR